MKEEGRELRLGPRVELEGALGDDAEGALVAEEQVLEPVAGKRLADYVEDLVTELVAHVLDLAEEGGQDVALGSTSTSIFLASGLNPSVSGAPISFTATVSPVPPSAGVPTGTLTFKDGVTSFGSGPLSGGLYFYTLTNYSDIMKSGKLLLN